MNWIKVNESLPKKGKDVLCMMRTDEGKIMPVIRWRSEYDDTVVDSNGFTIYKPTEVEVVAWMEIPKYKHSNSSKKANRSSKSIKTFTVNGISFNMIYVEGGTFTMGATPEQGDDASFHEKPVHDVALSNYYIAETQVTQELWQAVMGNNPSKFRGAKRPVENVSWNECKAFIEKLKQLTRKKFRLPTEAEWEYAARGGNKAQGYTYAGSNTIGNVAWCYNNSYVKGSSHPDYGTHPVKQKKANELGLYDMTGNVWEWCYDWYNSEYYLSSPQMDPIGPSSGSERVLRGGDWGASGRFSRIATRLYYSPTGYTPYFGFRLVLSRLDL